MTRTKDGGRYEGEWRSGVRHGMGKAFYGPGSAEASYNGSWAEGQRSGLGILEMANGDRFEGHWLGDKKEGPGRYFYSATSKVGGRSAAPWRFGSRGLPVR